ncbi:hypothetical protein TWF225_003404 [Orbilia oligospora]|uniref:Uncharacterized protein n=1 Tax=Orbilia oligospora TaxID=2813651 RepID=A0A7C8PTS8_ORBOL|nr:hypothetical protein TWF751_000294 [Orbilia oligospora]KAF3188428.1 hypothetical protein TWF225_003404 [Orbilia oligospora]KAF3250045.1 hypothetical protein TWF128_007628 [Orbilia oligospora]KAF3263202.1 hypothetical protein TWF217_003643 [Orbilia oligospora]KAF3289053.1 hypothetical protein TWF132_007718 [Orbilia oligospora]
MDRKAQRIETIRAHLRNLIYDQHGELVDPKDITNTHRSRAPFQFVFKSDDPKQPKVSIASISQPDYDAIMRLIKAGRLRASRIDENLTFFGFKQDPDSSQRSPTEIFETSASSSPIESARQLMFHMHKRELSSSEETMPGRSQAGAILPTLPPFSTIMTRRNTSPLSPHLQTTQPPPPPHPQGFDSFIPLGSHPIPTAMAIDEPPGSPGLACWSQLNKHIHKLRLGAVQWAEDLGDIQTRVEELSKLENQVSAKSSQEIYLKVESLRSENSALRLRVEALEKENRDIKNQRDYLKGLLDQYGIPQHSERLSRAAAVNN